MERVGSLMTLFFSGEPVRNYEDAKRSDTRRFAAFFHQMLQRGVFLAPSQFEALLCPRGALRTRILTARWRRAGKASARSSSRAAQSAPSRLKMPALLDATRRVGAKVCQFFPATPDGERRRVAASSE